MMRLLSILAADLIFQDCFSPSSKIIGVFQSKQLIVVLIPADFTNINATNMCQSVFHDKEASAQIFFDGVAQLPIGIFTYKFNVSQNVTIQLDNAGFNTALVQKKASLNVIFANTFPVTFSINIIQHVMSNVAQCFGQANLTYDITGQKISVEVTPLSCDIDMTTATVTLKYNGSKTITIPQCTTGCAADEFKAGNTFQQIKSYKAVGVTGINDLLTYLVGNHLGTVTFNIKIVNSAVSVNVFKVISYKLAQDPLNCQAGMTPIVFYNALDVRAELFSGQLNNLACFTNLPTATHIRYQATIVSSTGNQVYTMSETLASFKQRQGFRIVNTSTLSYNSTESLLADIQFSFYTSSTISNAIYEFNILSNVNIGCFKSGVLKVYSDKLCADIQFINSARCNARTSTSTLTMQVMNMPDEADVSSVVWYGTFSLPSTEIKYGTYEQNFCATCTENNNAFPVQGGSCQASIKAFKSVVANDSPRFRLRTDIEYSTFDVAVINTYSSMWGVAIGVLSGTLAVGIVLSLVLTIRHATNQ
ncbi:Conserved_hypothetical protein [Hexamita inflata]|uniref:Uncharacterized protein n=1 Tax=Hexamita inflata TaxID=28002 RepID=A0AA86TJ01_9EUKA|nr:Conserved hypothetical protein [Hexamita inflata]